MKFGRNLPLDIFGSERVKEKFSVRINVSFCIYSKLLLLSSRD